MEAAIHIHEVTQEANLTFRPENLLHSIRDIREKNKDLVDESYKFAENILPTFESNLKTLLYNYEKVPSEHMEDIINKTYMPIEFVPGSYGVSPKMKSIFNTYGFRGTHTEILHKVKVLVNQVNEVYKTLYNHTFDYVKLTFYCGKCKKVNETFFHKMPHPSVHITCPKCLTEKMIPIHNNKDYNDRYHRYAENEYHPLQMEGIVLGISSGNRSIIKTINS